MLEQRDSGTPAVSIIVPVYNAEKTIHRCIDSILRQNCRDFELILADDGSRDASGAICDEYAAKDPRVHVIHKENTGVSDTRNTAIRTARGTWLQFVDSDDWLAPEATGLLLSAAARHCDLVVSDFYRVIDDRVAHKGDIQENGLLTREEYAAYMLEKPADFYYGVLWNKLYKKSIIDRYGIAMDTEINWCEDFMFNLEYLCHSAEIYILRVPIYYYVKTKTSLTNQGITFSKTIKMKAMVFEYYKRFYKEVFNEKDYEKSRLQVYRFLLDAANDGIVPPAILPGSLRLGEERPQFDRKVLENCSAMLEIYLNRKCLEICLQPLTYQHDLTLEEAYFLLFLSQSHSSYTRKELADFVGSPMRKLDGVMQKLKSRGYIAWTERTEAGKSAKGTAKLLEIQILPAADPVMAEMEEVKANYSQIVFSGFTEEEIALYRKMSEKVRSNIIQTLC